MCTVTTDTANKYARTVELHVGVVRGRVGVGHVASRLLLPLEAHLLAVRRRLRHRHRWLFVAGIAQ